MTEDELNSVCSRINQYLNQYFNEYILNTIDNLDSLLESYEYKPDEWDNNRATESTNIYTKLSLIINSREYLINLGKSEEEVDNMINKISNRYTETHKPYEKTINKKDNDLDFLEAIFENMDKNMLYQTIETDLQRKISHEEYISLCSDVNYIIQLFEKYILIGNDKFKFSEYDISKEELQDILNKTLLAEDNQMKI